MIVARHTWYMIGRQTRNLLREPIPILSRAARGSEIVRTIARELPPPPSLLGSLEQASGFLGLPQTFGGSPGHSHYAVTPD